MRVHQARMALIAGVGLVAAAGAVAAPEAAPPGGGFGFPLAGVAELADALDLGSSAARLVGSNPSARTTIPDRWDL